jgi:Ca2+-transporting ATPase
MTPAVFAGALVVHGSGLAEVAATGRHSAIGRIGGSLAAIAAEPSPLQREVRRALPVLRGAGRGGQPWPGAAARSGRW